MGETMLMQNWIAKWKSILYLVFFFIYIMNINLNLLENDVN